MTIIVYLKKSTKKDKKYMVYVEGKTIFFGARGMSDYTIHKDVERKKRYIIRHKKRENWTKTGIKTPGFWSRWLIWGEKTLSASKRYIEKKFGIKFKSGWPKESEKKKLRKKSSRMRFSDKSRKLSRKSSRKLSRKSSRKVSKKVSRKSPKKLSKKQYKAKIERCVLAVKEKQTDECKKNKFKGPNCVNPYSICYSRVKKYRT
jgi:hypothetical protein